MNLKVQDISSTIENWNFTKIYFDLPNDVIDRIIIVPISVGRNGLDKQIWIESYSGMVSKSQIIRTGNEYGSY